ncbi:hypothetical protein Rhopal_007333-T1 [Rhodotorula paludigena]|uniref:RNA polymerase II-associated protein 3 n=1 Tax=Rhodotorula paludigena TaxID=86838 RepID=A0AAV5GWB2_9BASI|nr:hypothetical protein Rhopal_007333-T1 [Rhodotorula paludigena]
MSARAEQLKAAGNAAFKAGDYTLALAHYSDAIHLDPSVSTYPLNRALVHLRLADYPAADKDASTALKLDAGVGQKALYRRALARKGLGKLDLAKQDLEEAKRQGAGDDVDKELAALTKQLDITGSKKDVKPLSNGSAKATPSTVPPAVKGTSPSTDRLRAALAPQSASASASSKPASNGLMTAVSTRRLSPSATSPAPAPPSPTPPAPIAAEKPVSSFAAKKEARTAKEQRPLRSPPPQDPEPAPPASATKSTPLAPPVPLAPPASPPAPLPPLASSVPPTFLRQPTSSTASPPPPASVTSLESHLLLAPPHSPSRLALLRALDPRALRAFVGDSLGPELVSAVLAELLPLFPSDADGGDDELEWIVPLLEALTTCKRWDSAVLFLEDAERAGVRRVFERAERRLQRAKGAWGL